MDVAVAILAGNLIGVGVQGDKNGKSNVVGIGISSR
jgi:hypothetical protein